MAWFHITQLQLLSWNEKTKYRFFHSWHMNWLDWTMLFGHLRPRLGDADRAFHRAWSFDSSRWSHSNLWNGKIKFDYFLKKLNVYKVRRICFCTCVNFISFHSQLWDIKQYHFNRGCFPVTSNFCVDLFFCPQFIT